MSGNLTAVGRQVDRLFAPVDIASLALFRVVYGLAMLCQVTLIFPPKRIHLDFIEPQFLFTYYGFGWLEPWPGAGMYLHFGVLACLSLLVMAGRWYRVSTALLFLGWTYVFLLDQTHYENHYYLLCLLSLLMIFVPAHRAFSLDALRRPKVRSATAPAWAVWLLRAQLGIVYFYGGLAKLNSDWLTGASMRYQLESRTDFPILGPYFGEDWMILFFTYGGLLLDLLIVPFLLWRRTRVWAFMAAVLFHLLNSRLFEIGVFPWFMLAGTTIFFDTDWPRRLVASIRRKAVGAGGGADDFVVRPPHRRVILTLLGIYLAVQLLVPLRHLLYPGPVSWNRFGARFSWRMRLHHRKLDHPEFLVTLPDQNRREILPAYKMLTPNQYQRMITRPDMLLQFSHFIADEYRRTGIDNAQVRIKASFSLNGRQRQYLIDPSVDLAAQPRSLGRVSWVSDLMHTDDQGSF